MTGPRWARAHDDGPSHAWPDEPVDGLLVALCGVQAEPAELADTRDHPCTRCLIAHGSALAERHGDTAWRP